MTRGADCAGPANPIHDLRDNEAQLSRLKLDQLAKSDWRILAGTIRSRRVECASPTSVGTCSAVCR